MCYIIDVKQRRSRTKEQKKMRQNKKRFAVVDFYEDENGDTLENFDDYKAAEEYAKMHIKECDGEACVFIADREKRVMHSV